MWTIYPNFLMNKDLIISIITGFVFGGLLAALALLML